MLTCWVRQSYKLYGRGNDSASVAAATLLGANGGSIFSQTSVVEANVTFKRDSKTRVRRGGGVMLTAAPRRGCQGKQRFASVAKHEASDSG